MLTVLDSHALLVYLEREPGFEKVEKLLVQAVSNEQNLLMSSVNFGEVYYIVHRECGEKEAEKIEKLIDTLPIEIISVDLDLAKEAAIFKSSKKMSYADCFAAALTKVHKAKLITGDPEFKEVEKVIKIIWL